MKFCEERPNCRRFVSSKRACDGYDSIRLAQTSTDSTGGMALRWVPSPSEAYSTDPREEEAIFRFRNCVVDGLYSTWDMDFWYRLVLPMSTHEPHIWHALVALGALDRAGDGDGAFGLRQYELAIQGLQSRIAGKDVPARALVLATCLLFVIVELLQHDFDQAQSHLGAGLSLIKDMQQDAEVRHKAPSTKTDLGRLEQLFGRLDNQMSLYTSNRVRLYQAVEHGRMASLPAELHFTSVLDSGTLHTHQVAAMRELVVEIESQRLGADDIAAADYMELEAQQGRQLISLTRWHSALQRFMPGIRDPHQRRLTKMLLMSHLCCKIRVLNALNDGRECDYDRYIAEFERIVELATEMLSANLELQHTASRISLETGIIAPLYYTAVKCRVSGLRRRAIALIRTSNSQEGA